MLKRPITYEDLDGNKVTETFYFNFTEAELIEMEVDEEGGLQALLQRIVATQDRRGLVKEFKKLVLAAYGVRSEDGRRFVKSDQLRLDFEHNPAYSALFMDLATNEGAGADFVNGVMPASLLRKVQEQKPTPVDAPPLPPVRQ